ncbi:hypothetical protein CPC08DRAFT_90675 [Agrocybe pediades]|nr:hypothetical protein CPC08DRAFT_90675 [Agrocybe pediades]
MDPRWRGLQGRIRHRRGANRPGVAFETPPEHPGRYQKIQKYNAPACHPGRILGASCVTDDKLDFAGLKHFEKLIVDTVLPRTECFSVEFVIWDEHNVGSIQKQMQRHLPVLQARNLLHFENDVT